MEHLSDLDRRVIGNLSIPRNADDLALRLRGFAAKQSADGTARFYTADEVDGLLRHDLSKRGLVKNVGQHVDPAKLASEVQKDKDTMELPDEKAEIYSRRLLRSDLNWRMDGDLWMLTQTGLDAMHAEPENTPPPMTPDQVQAVINSEWARVHKADVDEDTRLANALLESEFHHWLKLVLDDTRARWGEMAKNVRGPMAGGASGWSDFWETGILDHENQKTSLATYDPIAAPWYMGLSILALTDADTGTTLDNGSHIPTYTGYARKSVAAADMNAAASPGGSASNANAIVFAACTAGTSTILAAANCVAATVNNIRKWFDVASTVISTTQTPAQFAAAAYTTTAA